jgi:sulfite exporter TauE/SafE
MPNSFIFAIFALLAFGFVFKVVSDEERRAFFRTLVAALLVVGLVSLFAFPLVRKGEVKHFLDTVSIISFVLAALFLLAYIKMDQKIRIERGELHPPTKRGGKNGRAKK